MLPLPDKLSVAIDRAHPVEGDGVDLAGGIAQQEGEVIVRVEAHRGERDDDDPSFQAVVVAEGKRSPAIFPVPADAVEQGADRDDRFSKWGVCTAAEWRSAAR